MVHRLLNIGRSSFHSPAQDPSSKDSPRPVQRSPNSSKDRSGSTSLDTISYTPVLCPNSLGILLAPGGWSSCVSHWCGFFFSFPCLQISTFKAHSPYSQGISPCVCSCRNPINSMFQGGPAGDALCWVQSDPSPRKRAASRI